MSEPIAWFVTDAQGGGTNCWGVYEEESEARAEAERRNKIGPQAGVLYSGPFHHAPLYATTATKAPEGWQPIESAPREERILLWDGKFTAAGAYCEYDSIGWVMDCYEPTEYPTPTHWMPLPAPPAAAPPSSEHCGFSDNTCDCVDECKIDGGYLR